MRERIVIAALRVLGAIFYLPYRLFVWILSKLSKEGPGWGD